MGMFFNLQHTHPGVDKSSQVPGSFPPLSFGSYLSKDATAASLVELPEVSSIGIPLCPPTIF